LNPTVGIELHKKIQVSKAVPATKTSPAHSVIMRVCRVCRVCEIKNRRRRAAQGDALLDRELSTLLKQERNVSKLCGVDAV
jgi:predicted metal-binding protein